MKLHLKMANKALVFSLDKRFKNFERNIKKKTLAGLKILKKKNVSVEIYLLGNSKIRFLNKKFRGKDKPTDVLSFEEPKRFILPPSKIKKIGEIYLNLEKTADYELQITTKQNKAIVHSLWTVDSLLIHGLLHLAGYDHRKKNDTIKMEKMERLVIRRLAK